MNRTIVIFSFLLLLTSTLFAKQSFEYQHQFSLKKDEIATIIINRKEVVKKPQNDNPTNEYILHFRWTLYANNTLIVLVNYRGYPTQYTMQKKSPLDSVIIPLLPDSIDRINGRVYLKMVFNDFSQGNKEAIFDIFIEDTNQRILVEFKPNKVVGK
ncbi:MAG: hypothetical protein PHN18_06315 [Sulfurospirillaceae bacterium]|jgi:hypothetical protein|nr:hypothetical protein [Sulfurospirillaceae bacterium]MDD2825928.1 hypothetical protein [Sulfurospirillaceae bacterium]